MTDRIGLKVAGLIKHAVAHAFGRHHGRVRGLPKQPAGSQTRPVAGMFRLVCVGLLLLFAGCGGSSGNSDNREISRGTRSFYMGFTPWPYEATQSAINNTYSLIQASGDIVSHHLMVGIPWQEAYEGSALPGHVEDELATRISLTGSQKKIVLSIDSLNTARDDLAANWGEAGTEPRTPPWDTRSFSDPEVAEAYVDFALRMIERFEPDYFNYAPEISELILNDVIKYSEFVTFSQRVYEAVKREHPDLPLLVSVALKTPGSAEAVAIAAGFPSILPYVDMVGVSAYPYAFFEHSERGDPANLPEEWLQQITELASNKPVAINETGWIAENLEISSFGYSAESNLSKQQDYVNELLAVANELEMVFVIWFTMVDYDVLWQNELGQDDLAKLWKDTGLYDENINARPALDTWNSYYARERN